jgi:hypothetical protein
MGLTLLVSAPCLLHSEKGPKIVNKLLIAAFAACLATSVSAKQEMTVTANPSFASWAETSSRTLGEAFDRVDLSRSEAGITYVRFTCDEDGRPQNITTVPSREGKPNLARVGRKAIANIHALPMFAGARPDQVIEAAIIVADGQDQMDRMLAKVNDRARQQNAQWAARGTVNPVVALAAVGGF